MWKAAWAVDGSTSWGSVIPRTVLAWSRAALTASRMLSVPPLVNVPWAPGAPSSAATAPTTSFSSRATLGKTVGSSPLTVANAVYASAASSSRPSSPAS